MKDIIASLGFIAVIVVWVSVIARGIARLFHVPVGKGFFWLNVRHEKLTRSQYIWTNGVLVYAMVLFLSRFYLESMDWILEGKSGSAPTIGHFLLELGICVLFGLLFGIWSAPSRRSRTTQAENPISANK
jgi:hypothetical protein